MGKPTFSGNFCSLPMFTCSLPFFSLFLKKDEEKREGEGGQVNIWALGKQTFDGKILQFTHALYIHFIIYYLRKGGPPRLLCSPNQKPEVWTAEQSRTPC